MIIDWSYVYREQPFCSTPFSFLSTAGKRRETAHFSKMRSTVWATAFADVGFFTAVQPVDLPSPAAKRSLLQRELNSEFLNFVAVQCVDRFRIPPLLIVPANAESIDRSTIGRWFHPPLASCLAPPYQRSLSDLPGSLTTPRNS